MIIDKLFPLL